VRIGKPSLYAITHFAIFIPKIYFLTSAKGVIFGFKAAVKKLLDRFFRKSVF